MGLGPSKEKIRKILEKSMTNPNINEQKNLKIEYKYKQGDGMDIEEAASNQNSSEGSDYQENSDSFNFSTDENQTITSPLQDVKNVKKFPYIAIGTLTVKFPSFDEDYQYTCFLIDTNVVVTLASNLEDKNKGGKAKSIKTTFSDEKVKWENVRIQGEDDKKDKKNEKKQKAAESIDNLNKGSKLAVILYEENIGSEWIGVEGGKAEDFSGRDINVVFTLGKKDNKGESDGNKKKVLLMHHKTFHSYTRKKFHIIQFLFALGEYDN